MPDPITPEPTPTPGAPTPVPAPVPTPPAPTGQPAPAPFDVKSLPPEAQAWVREQIAAADQKARTQSKANAAKEATESTLSKIAQALGLAPDATKDPDALAKQLREAQSEARALHVDTAIEKAARKAGGDEDLVSAWLAKHARTALKELDPNDAGFRKAVDDLVVKAIEEHPRLKAESAGPAPAARGGATSTAMAGAGAAAAQDGAATGGPDWENMSVEDMRKALYSRK
jgi:hypothetical protein